MLGGVLRGALRCWTARRRERAESQRAAKQALGTVSKRAALRRWVAEKSAAAVRRRARTSGTGDGRQGVQRELLMRAPGARARCAAALQLWHRAAVLRATRAREMRRARGAARRRVLARAIAAMHRNVARAVASSGDGANAIGVAVDGDGAGVASSERTSIAVQWHLLHAPRGPLRRWHTFAVNHVAARRVTTIAACHFAGSDAPHCASRRALRTWRMSLAADRAARFEARRLVAADAVARSARAARAVRALRAHRRLGQAACAARVLRDRGRARDAMRRWTAQCRSASRWQHAAAFWDMCLARTVLRAWRGAAVARADRTAANLAADLVRTHRVARAALGALGAAVARARADRVRVARADAVRRRRALRTWARNGASSAVRRVATDAADVFYGRIIAAKVFARWLDFADASRRARVFREGVARRSATTRRRRIWARWGAYVAEEQRARAANGAALGHWARHLEQRVWSGLAAYTGRRRAKRATAGRARAMYHAARLREGCARFLEAADEVRSIESDRERPRAIESDRERSRAIESDREQRIDRSSSSSRPFVEAIHHRRQTESSDRNERGVAQGGKGCRACLDHTAEPRHTSHCVARLTASGVLPSSPACRIELRSHRVGRALASREEATRALWARVARHAQHWRATTRRRVTRRLSMLARAGVSVRSAGRSAHEIAAFGGAVAPTSAEVEVDAAVAAGLRARGGGDGGGAADAAGSSPSFLTHPNPLIDLDRTRHAVDGDGGGGDPDADDADALPPHMRHRHPHFVTTTDLARDRLAAASHAPFAPRPAPPPPPSQPLPLFDFPHTHKQRRPPRRPLELLVETPPTYAARPSPPPLPRHPSPFASSAPTPAHSSLVTNCAPLPHAVHRPQRNTAEMQPPPKVMTMAAAAPPASPYSPYAPPVGSSHSAPQPEPQPQMPPQHLHPQSPSLSQSVQPQQHRYARSPPRAIAPASEGAQAHHSPPARCDAHYHSEEPTGPGRLLRLMPRSLGEPRGLDSAALAGAPDPDAAVAAALAQRSRSPPQQPPVPRYAETCKDAGGVGVSAEGTVSAGGAVPTVVAGPGSTTAFADAAPRPRVAQPERSLPPPPPPPQYRTHVSPPPLAPPGGECGGGVQGGEPFNELATLEAHLGMLLHQRNHWLAQRRELDLQSAAASAAAASAAAAAAGPSGGVFSLAPPSSAAERSDAAASSAAAAAAARYDAAMRSRMVELEAHMRGFADWRTKVAPDVKLCTERISALRRARLLDALAPGLDFATATTTIASPAPAHPLASHAASPLLR